MKHLKRFEYHQKHFNFDATLSIDKPDDFILSEDFKEELEGGRWGEDFEYSINNVEVELKNSVYPVAYVNMTGYVEVYGDKSRYEVEEAVEDDLQEFIKGISNKNASLVNLSLY